MNPTALKNMMRYQLTGMMTCMLMACLGAGCADPARAAADPDGVTQQDFDTLWNFKELFTCPQQVTWGEKKPITRDFYRMKGISFTDPLTSNPLQGYVQDLYFDSVPYRGKPTRVFARYARPDGKGPFPAMLLIHGGGGTAIPEWAEHWARRGYAALVFDLKGCGPTDQRMPDGLPSLEDNTIFGAPTDTPEGTEAQEFGFISLSSLRPGAPTTTTPDAKRQRDPRDIWAYQAIAAIVRGHALLESFPDIDKERIGATGISWGAYLSCIIAGFDPKLKVVVPVFGCGFYQEEGAWEGLLNQKMSKKNMQKWVALYDPSSHTQHARCAMMFANGTNDSHFPMNTLKKSALQCQGSVAMCLILHIIHQHRWDIREVEPYVDSIIDFGTPFLKVSRLKRSNLTVSATYSGPVEARRAALVFTCDSGPWRPRVWDTLPAMLDPMTHTLSADLPQDKKVSAYFLSLTDERNFTVSTLHEENTP